MLRDAERQNLDSILPVCGEALRDTARQDFS
jgi:hypothetical protein